MAYATTCQVYAHVHALVSPASAFSSATCPTTDEVTVWLSGGCALINARLAAGGYGAIPATSPAYELAGAANALYGAWMAERQRVNARVSADERTRADMFKRDFEFHLTQLLAMDLGSVGVSQTSRVYAGGISISDKEAQEADPDRVKPRFHRGMMTNPEAGRPRADSNNDD